MPRLIISRFQLQTQVRTVMVDMLVLTLSALIMLYVVILWRNGATKTRGSCTRCEVLYFILLQRAVSHRRKHVSVWYHFADQWIGLQGTVI
jgi:hypothetical protein